MNPYKLALLAIYGVALLFTIGMVGKERRPLAPHDAVFSAIVTAGLVTLVVLS